MCKYFISSFSSFRQLFFRPSSVSCLTRSWSCLIWTRPSAVRRPGWHSSPTSAARRTWSTTSGQTEDMVFCVSTQIGLLNNKSSNRPGLCGEQNMPCDRKEVLPVPRGTPTSRSNLCEQDEPSHTVASIRPHSFFRVSELQKCTGIVRVQSRELPDLIFSFGL